MTGALKQLSNAGPSSGGKAADDDRMKRKGFRRMTSGYAWAPSRIAWCIVGTAVYQVGRTSSNQSKKRPTSPPAKPGVQATLPPAANEANTAATSPWI